MSTDTHSGTIEFPYKPSLRGHVIGMVVVGAASAYLIWPLLQAYHGNMSEFYDYFLTRSKDEKDRAMVAVVALVYALYCLGQLPGMLSAGDLAVLRVAHDGVTLPTGYFEVRQMFIAAEDITDVQRTRTRYGERIGIRHKNGRVFIEKHWLPNDAAFGRVWQALQRFKKPVP